MGLRKTALAVAFTVGLAAGGDASAQQVGPPDPPRHSLYGDVGTPNFSGLWVGSASRPPAPVTTRSAEVRPPVSWAPWPPPLTPDYQKRADERIASARAGRVLGDIGARCLPFGQPWAFTFKAYPDEIIQTPGVVTLYAFNTFPIFIWTDGRGHPADLKPSYNGHSIGTWVGDTLHVETVGIIDTTTIDAALRTPHSAKLKMLTRIKRVAPDVLHFNVTLIDEDALTEPMVMTNIFRRMSGPRWEVLDDNTCFENNQYANDPGGTAGFLTF